ncbi:MAG: helix-turn-helix transcriptional regulator [Ruminococcus sp.]
MNFNQRIAYLLKEKKCSQADLAKSVGVKPNTVSDWINKGTSPKVEHIYAIAQYFDVSIDYLFYGKENSNSILNSNIGAIGTNSSGTVNIHSDDQKSEFDEISKEITRIIKGLPLKERSRLLTLIYEFEERCCSND